MSDAGWDMGNDPSVAYGGSYTPTWTSTGTAPSLGNGTILGEFSLILPNKLLWVSVDLLWGSTTTGGTGAWGFSLPSGFATRAIYAAGGGRASDSNTSNTYVLVPDIGPSGTGFFPVYTTTPGSLLGVASPMTWATSDRLVLTAVVALA